MYRDVPGRTYPYFTLFIFTFTPDYSPTCINLFTFAESNILNTHNHEFKKNSQLTTDTQEDILYKHCETTGKAELQAIRQIKEYLEKLNREHELSDQAFRELKQLSKEIDKFVADCKKEKSRKRIG